MESKVIIGALLLFFLAYVFCYPFPVWVLAFLLTVVNGYDIFRVYCGPELCIYKHILLVYSVFGIIAMLEDYSSMNRTLLFQKILVVSLSDIVQCFSGTYYGKNLVGGPSPKKTWEGYMGAMIFALMCTPIFSFSIIWVFLGILGDLFVSMCKRKIGIKDTSRLLGSHGGWLDRVDGIYMTVIVTKFI